jgi:hypothetical protein
LQLEKQRVKMPMTAPNPSHAAELLRLTYGAWIAQAIGVAARLRLADLMVRGPQSVDALANATGTHPSTLYRLLRALASTGVFVENEEGAFALTPLAEGLRSDVDGSLQAICVLRTEPWAWDAWGDLLHSVTTGESAIRHVHGSDLFGYLDEHPETQARFNQAMVSLSSTEIASILAAYDFSGFPTIADIGGGKGALLAAILSAYPLAQGILFDQPSTISGAGALLEQANVADRCVAVAGSFFEDVPEGGDLYLLKSIVHDWNDDRAELILRTCRQAMAPRARLLLIERVIPPGNTPSFAKWMDLNMLIVADGRERTEAEFASLLDRTGFVLQRVIPTSSPVSLVEAAPISG